MPSGYEKSPDYGGPEPNRRLWLMLTLAMSPGMIARGFWMILKA